MIHRVNITIDRVLHEKAKQHAKTVHYTDFSGLVSKLLVDDLRSSPTPPGATIGDISSASDIQRAKRLAAKDLARALHQPAKPPGD